MIRTCALLFAVLSGLFVAVACQAQEEVSQQEQELRDRVGRRRAGQQPQTEAQRKEEAEKIERVIQEMDAFLNAAANAAIDVMGDDPSFNAISDAFNRIVNSGTECNEILASEFPAFASDEGSAAIRAHRTVIMNVSGHMVERLGKLEMTLACVGRMSALTAEEKKAVWPLIERLRMLQDQRATVNILLVDDIENTYQEALIPQAQAVLDAACTVKMCAEDPESQDAEIEAAMTAWQQARQALDQLIVQTQKDLRQYLSAREELMLTREGLFQ